MIPPIIIIMKRIMKKIEGNKIQAKISNAQSNAHHLLADAQAVPEQQSAPSG